MSVTQLFPTSMVSDMKENYYVVSAFRIELLILQRLQCPSFTTAEQRYV